MHRKDPYAIKNQQSARNAPSSYHLRFGLDATRVLLRSEHGKKTVLLHLYSSPPTPTTATAITTNKFGKTGYELEATGTKLEQD